MNRIDINLVIWAEDTNKVYSRYQAFLGSLPYAGAECQVAEYWVKDRWPERDWHTSDCGYTVTGHYHNCSCGLADRWPEGDTIPERGKV